MVLPMMLTVAGPAGVGVGPGVGRGVGPGVETGVGRGVGPGVGTGVTTGIGPGGGVGVGAGVWTGGSVAGEGDNDGESEGFEASDGDGLSTSATRDGLDSTTGTNEPSAIAAPAVPGEALSAKNHSGGWMTATAATTRAPHRTRAPRLSRITRSRPNRHDPTGLPAEEDVGDGALAATAPAPRPSLVRYPVTRRSPSRADRLPLSPGHARLSRTMPDTRIARDSTIARTGGKSMAYRALREIRVSPEIICRRQATVPPSLQISRDGP